LVSWFREDPERKSDDDAEETGAPQHSESETRETGDLQGEIGAKENEGKCDCADHDAQEQW
jgi:hypothetical protein